MKKALSKFAEPEINEVKTIESEMNNKDDQVILKLRKEAIEYTQGQIEALVKIQVFLDGERRYFLLAGYAGTGKTTIIENIVNYLNKKDEPTVIVAPTNKAVTVLKKSFLVQKLSLNLQLFIKLYMDNLTLRQGSGY